MSLSLHWEKIWRMTNRQQGGKVYFPKIWHIFLVILEYFILSLVWSIQFVNNAHENCGNTWLFLEFPCHIIIGSIKSSHFMTDCEKKLWWETHKLLFACSIHFVLCLVHFIHTTTNNGPNLLLYLTSSRGFCTRRPVELFY